MQKIIIGTSQQNLALAQSKIVKKELEALTIDVELKILKPDSLRQTLLKGDIDMCVYALSNLSAKPIDGLKITALSRREHPADWLVIHKNSIAENRILKLKENAQIGFSSILRKFQLLEFRTDLQFVNTASDLLSQLAQLEKGVFDAIVLAACDLIRLETDLSNFIVIKFNPKEFIPAVGQGILAYQTRTDDLKTRRILKNIHHNEVVPLSNIERKVLQNFDEKQFALGVHCEMDILENYHTQAIIIDKIDHRIFRTSNSSSTSFQVAEKITESLNNGITNS